MNILVLSPTSPLIKLYEGSLRTWDAFRDSESYHYWDRRNLNLCHFMRTIFFYAPLVLFLHLFTLAYLVWVLAINPVILFGTIPYLTVIGWILFTILAVCVGVGIAMLLCGGIVVTVEKCKDLLEKGDSTVVQAMNLFWKWLVAKKHKYCPIILVKDEENRDV